MKRMLCTVGLWIVALEAMASGALVTVSTPNMSGEPGSIVTVPILIDQAADLHSFDLEIFYDTSILDLANSDVKIGSLTSGWPITANVNDVTGLVLITGSAPYSLAGGSGSLFTLDFHIPASVTSGSSIIDVGPRQEYGWGLNDGEIPMNSNSDGMLTVTPEPGSLTIIAFAGAAAVMRRRRR